MTRHACAAPAESRGPFGALCSSCWERVLAILERVPGWPRRPGNAR